VESIDFHSLLVDCTRAGLDPLRFWEMTPREVGVYLEAAAWRAEQGVQEMLALAWHVAALQRQKRLQSLKSLLRPASKARDVPIAERRREFAELSEAYARHRAGQSKYSDSGDDR